MAKEKTASKKPKKAVKTSSKKNNMSLYSNLAYKRRVKADQKSRKQAEDLASMPKNPFLRFFARLRPDRVFRFWFSKEGFFRIIKFLAACFLIAIVAIGGLFLYFKKDLSQIDPEELASRVTNTVNTYQDRNGVVLWEDKGNGDYRLVVDGSEISSYMRQATVAIEDKSFYNHIGVDFSALVRAALSTLSGNSVQGGSTLTQQLIKQVYFSDEAGDRTVTGLPRKIKETILALEVEKMYDKEQIITMYLNESPYGGRRNGVESGARTYFGKSAKDLNLAEAALLAAIPNNPAVLNPYNSAGNKALIARQRKTLNVMVEMNYITQEQCDEASAFDILDTILPESSQFENIKAPWFVLEVKAQLEAKYGVKTMRAGGFTITTTLDYRAQEIAEKAVAQGAAIMKKSNNSDNIALTSIDVETSQVIAMVGSVGWNVPEYGQLNAATSLLEPASSIKPVLDYAPLLTQRSGQNWGPGSTLRDENIDSIYCAGYVGKCQLRNASGRFYGDISVRQALAGSLNIPAVKALYINGIENSLEIAHALGDVSYCASGNNAGLSMAIGGGCTVRPVEHANAYASLARNGAYKPITYWLEVKNSSGDIIDSWEDTAATQVIDPQVAYMVTDILADVDARKFTFGSYLATDPGFYNKDVWYAAKTGTTENGGGKAKDSWLMTYSPVLATAIWNGNHNGSSLNSGNHTTAFKVGEYYTASVHKNVYGADGKWYTGMKIEAPAGIQTLTVNGRRDIWPSWYGDNTSGVTKQVMVFDSVTKKLATSCTPAETRIEITVSKIIDPMTKKEIWYTNGYDKDNDDDLHQCTDIKPQVSSINIQDNGDDTWTIIVAVAQGTHALADYTTTVNGSQASSGAITSSAIQFTVDTLPSTVSVKITDTAGYTASGSKNN
ncbi:MAG: penicillin-binding protein [Candidatus Nomurabacteria bacterium]|jgi:penicillin-binding protein 1A|nr:penicillin-binding protein [Candidatus Nomurabacteria bacterium]